MYHFRLRIITDEIIDRFREIKAGTEDARQELHETREQIMEDQFGKIYFPTYIHLSRPRLALPCSALILQ